MVTEEEAKESMCIGTTMLVQLWWGVNTIVKTILC